MIRNGFGAVKAEAAPSFAFGGLEALEEVEEGYRRGAVFFYWVRNCGQDCLGA